MLGIDAGMMGIRSKPKDFQQVSQEIRATFIAGCQVLAEHVAFSMKNLAQSRPRYFRLEPIVLELQEESAKRVQQLSLICFFSPW